MKSLKFRAYSESQKEWHYFTPDNISTYKQTFELHVLNGDEFYLYSGWNDINYKEIYEGQVVELSNHKMQIQKMLLEGVVVFQSASFAVKITKVKQWEKYRVDKPELESIYWFLNLGDTIVEIKEG